MDGLTACAYPVPQRMRTVLLSLLILGTWLILVYVIGLFPSDVRREDLVPMLLMLSISAVVGLLVGCFVTRKQPFRAELLGVAVVGSGALILVLFVAFSAMQRETFIGALAGALLYSPAICIFSIPAAATCLLAQGCRGHYLRRQR